MTYAVDIQANYDVDRVGRPKVHVETQNIDNRFEWDAGRGSV